MDEFIPAVGCVLIKPLQDGEKVIASTDRNYDRMGEVMVVADMVSLNPMPKVGDIIFYDEYAYRRFTYNGKDYCVVNVSGEGLWGVIKKHDTQGSDLQA